MDKAIQFQAADPDPDTRYKNISFGSSMTEDGYKIVKTDASILARMDPKVFNPEKGNSKKTDLGYHDLSALLLNPLVPISLQQYKGRDGKIDFTQTYCFMPLSFPMDQAVFQNINMLAKVNREQQGDFYDTVIGIRSKLTRIKLAAEQVQPVSASVTKKPGWCPETRSRTS